MHPHRCLLKCQLHCSGRRGSACSSFSSPSAGTRGDSLRVRALRCTGSRGPCYSVTLVVLFSGVPNKLNTSYACVRRCSKGASGAPGVKPQVLTGGAWQVGWALWHPLVTGGRLYVCQRSRRRGVLQELRLPKTNGRGLGQRGSRP